MVAAYKMQPFAAWQGDPKTTKKLPKLSFLSLSWKTKHKASKSKDREQSLSFSRENPFSPKNSFFSNSRGLLVQVGEKILDPPVYCKSKLHGNNYIAKNNIDRIMFYF